MKSSRVTINFEESLYIVPVKLIFKSGGYMILNGATALKHKICGRISYMQRQQYEFFSSQLNRNKEIEEC